VEQNKRDFCVGEYTTGAPLSNAAALVKWPWNLKLRVHNFACVFFLLTVPISAAFPFFLACVF
jgi:hypothetical protein